MGKNSIDRGNRDSWTFTPTELDSLDARIARERPNTGGRMVAGTQGGAGGAINPFGGAAPSKYFAEYMRDPAKRDARGYIVPSNQPDFLTATKFITALRKVNVTAPSRLLVRIIRPDRSS